MNKTWVPDGLSDIVKKNFTKNWMLSCLVVKVFCILFILLVCKKKLSRLQSHIDLKLKSLCILTCSLNSYFSMILSMDRCRGINTDTSVSSAPHETNALNPFSTNKSGFLPQNRHGSQGISNYLHFASV